MGRINFSRELDPERSAKAMGYELNISPRHSYELCNALRDLPVAQAKTVLEGVVALKRAIPFRRYNSGVGHRSGTGAGRYPKKAAAEFLKVLRDAEGNATYKGLDPEKMLVRHISAKRGRITHGSFPRAQGRATDKKAESVTLEVILEEPPAEGGAATVEKPAAAEGEAKQ